MKAPTSMSVLGWELSRHNGTVSASGGPSKGPTRAVLAPATVTSMSSRPGAGPHQLDQSNSNRPVSPGATTSGLVRELSGATVDVDSGPPPSVDVITTAG